MKSAYSYGKSRRKNNECKEEGTLLASVPLFILISFMMRYVSVTVLSIHFVDPFRKIIIIFFTYIMQMGICFFTVNPLKQLITQTDQLLINNYRKSHFGSKNELSVDWNFMLTLILGIFNLLTLLYLGARSFEF